MSDPTGNVDAAGNAELPEKYRGKSAAEIAKMHTELEGKLGEQGTELGQLRQQVTQLAGALESSKKPVESGTTSKDRWKKYGERLIMDPESAVADLAEEIKREARDEMRRETSTQLSYQQQVSQFFDANPELKPYTEIVSVIGSRIFEANPNADFTSILGETKKRSLEYISSLRERLGAKGDTEAERKRKAAGMTTSGGMHREGAENLGPEEREKIVEDERVVAINEELKRISEWKSKKVLPPSARAK